jgi:hypothetical protein
MSKPERANNNRAMDVSVREKITIEKSQTLTKRELFLFARIWDCKTMVG